MAVTHQNRKGEIYHLLVGKTKTGKPKYYVSKKPADNALEAIPEGYELFENPADAIVHVRKIRPTVLTPFEREQVVTLVRSASGKKHYFVVTDGDAFVVYWPQTDPDRSASLMSRLLSMDISAVESLASWSITHGRYEPLMRFVLTNAEDRLYVAERMCFRGQDEKWISLSMPGLLAELVPEYSQHLGKESFFDLI